MTERPGYAAQLEWVQGFQFVAHAETSGATAVFDAGLAHGGADQGLRPSEGVLMSLASCTGMDVISILKKKRQRVSGLHLNVHGFTASEHPKRFERIELEFIVRGQDVSESAVAQAIELSQTKYCAVSASLNAEITCTYRVEPDEA